MTGVGWERLKSALDPLADAERTRLFECVRAQVVHGTAAAVFQQWPNLFMIVSDADIEYGIRAYASTASRESVPSG